jgi:protein arginine N-methyltransferase 1
MYSVTAFGSMIADRVRTDSYCEALRQAIRSESVVLDIGTGTGIFALLACKFGARKIYAVEPSDAIEVARQIARANGYEDRIEFIQARTTEIELPEQADVIVSDIRGVLPLFGDHVSSIIDARERLLARGGVLVPQVDTLWAAIVEAPELYKWYAEPWEHDRYDLDLTAARPLATNTWGKGRVKREQLLVEPECWATLDYRAIDQPNVRGEVTWTAARPGTAHGLSIWFDATLIDGITYSNSPFCPELVYGSAFFPWSVPLLLHAGDAVAVALQANLVGDDYVWEWGATVSSNGNPTQIKTRLQQSTFFGAPLSLNRLQKRSERYVPQLNEDAQIDRFILGLLDGTTPIGQVARCAAERFPARFPKWEDALVRVSNLSVKYT